MKKIKNCQPQTKFTGSYKKKSVLQILQDFESCQTILGHYELKV